jgi:hypothetical protein
VSLKSVAPWMAELLLASLLDSSPLANKAGMTETERGAKQHGRASSTCGIHPPRRIAWGCESMYGVFVARCAHSCALARRANPS